MNTSYIRNMKNIESNSVDSWYNVCYCVPFRHMDFKETRCDTTRFAYNKLRLDSLGGWDYILLMTKTSLWCLIGDR